MADTKDDKRVSDSSYDAQYPYNHVWEDWAGHQIQVDNTPGAERIFFRHSKGSYVEMRPDGGVITFNVGDSKTYNKAGATFTVDECGDVKFTGHTRIMVGGGAHIEVAGDAGVFAGGDLVAAVMGNANIRAKSAYLGTDGDINMNASGNMNIKVAGDTTMETDGTHTIKAKKITMNP